MAEISTPALRMLIERWGGCDYYFSEMISAGALLAGSRWERYYLEAAPAPDKLVHQLVGSDAREIELAAGMLDEREGAGIDINMGCSAPEIQRRGAGLAWMKQASAAQSLVERVRRRVRRKRLSVKLRLGLDDSLEYLLDFCRRLEQAGCDFITIHPRTGREKFKRLARWEYTAAVRRELSIPVVGNGDVAGWAEFKSRVQDEASQAVMIGRAAVRAPWIFASIRARQRDPAARLSIDLAEAAGAFLELLPALQPPDFLESRARRFLEYFSRNLEYGHHFFNQVRNAGDFDSISSVVRRYFEEHPEYRQYVEKN